MSDLSPERIAVDVNRLRLRADWLYGVGPIARAWVADAIGLMLSLQRKYEVLLDLRPLQRELQAEKERADKAEGARDHLYKVSIPFLREEMKSLQAKLSTAEAEIAKLRAKP